MYKLRTHPEADRELEDIIQRLKDGTLWQASRFADHYYSALLKIREHPEGAHFIWTDYRRLNLKRYPYGLIYRQRDDGIYLIAVAHERRHPDCWKHRIQDNEED